MTSRNKKLKEVLKALDEKEVRANQLSKLSNINESSIYRIRRGLTSKPSTSTVNSLYNALQEIRANAAEKLENPTETKEQAIDISEQTEDQQAKQIRTNLIGRLLDAPFASLSKMRAILNKLNKREELDDLLLAESYPLMTAALKSKFTDGYVEVDMDCFAPNIKVGDVIDIVSIRQEPIHDGHTRTVLIEYYDRGETKITLGSGIIIFDLDSGRKSQLVITYDNRVKESIILPWKSIKQFFHVRSLFRGEL